MSKKLTKYQYDFLQDTVEGSWELDTSTGLVNVVGDVWVNANRLSHKQKLPVKFGKITGCFTCNYNNLKTLEGSPYYVGGSFSCSNNSLTTLEFAPSYVGVSFSCDGNELTSLEGAPKTINGNFFCCSNRIQNLIGGPHTVNGSYSCTDNPINSLEGIPINIGMYLSIDIEKAYLDAFMPVLERLTNRGTEMLLRKEGEYEHYREIWLKNLMRLELY